MQFTYAVSTDPHPPKKKTMTPVKRKKGTLTTEFGKMTNFLLEPYKVGPLLIIDGDITRISRVFSPQLPIYKAIYRDYNSIYNW